MKVISRCIQSSEQQSLSVENAGLYISRPWINGAPGGNGLSPSGKAVEFDSTIRWFKSN